MKIKILIFVILSLLLSNNILAKEMELNWSFKKSSNGAAYTLNITKVKLVRDKLRFSLLFHNTGGRYACYHINTSDKTVTIDDELGNEYFGSSFRAINGQNNKLAPNQRKQAIYETAVPIKDVNIINLRLGFTITTVDSNQLCSSPSRYTAVTNHKLNWDISALREAE